jgi:formamidopyrimidine-DNA glycosylase
LPELPEVETTRRGIAPHIIGQTVRKVIIRNGNLRWPVPLHLDQTLQNHAVFTIDRRGKYILVRFEHGTLILHLGMSGSQHKLLADLGPEPLQPDFNGDHLFHASRGRTQAVKTFIMDSHVVVGVGNIYASEALFAGGIRPQALAGKVSRDRYWKLAAAIRSILNKAISKGGTTLRDFTNSDGKPGYFQQKLNVYGRDQLPCRKCKQPIQLLVIGQRASYFCRHCQR